MSQRAPEPGRTCVGCRRQRPRAELIRIVRGPDGLACFDPEGRLPGRGAWVCPSSACVSALAAGALSHVLHAPVRLAPAAERLSEVTAALRRRVANLMTMSRRMRAVSFGPTGVRATLAEGRAALVLLAGDLPADATASWAARAAAVPVRTVPDAPTLGLLFGRGPVEVAALTSPGLAAALRPALDRWRAFFADSCNNERSITDEASRSARGSAAAGGG